MAQAVQGGVDINSKDGDGSTPIQLAFQERKTQAVEWLLNESADTADVAPSRLVETVQ